MMCEYTRPHEIKSFQSIYYWQPIQNNQEKNWRKNTLVSEYDQTSLVKHPENKTLNAEAIFTQSWGSCQMAAPFRQYSSIRWQTALAVCWDITLMVGVGQDISIPSASSNSYKGGAMLPLVLSVLNNGSRTEDRQTDRQSLVLSLLLHLATGRKIAWVCCCWSLHGDSCRQRILINACHSFVLWSCCITCSASCPSVCEQDDRNITEGFLVKFNCAANCSDREDRDWE